jgi:hypothetical protein
VRPGLCTGGLVIAKDQVPRPVAFVILAMPTFLKMPKREGIDLQTISWVDAFAPLAQ